jgi:hypothetical protein
MNVSERFVAVLDYWQAPVRLRCVPATAPAGLDDGPEVFGQGASREDGLLLIFRAPKISRIRCGMARATLQNIAAV